MSRQITIDPITRLEGHGKIEIFLDDEGDVANAYFQVPEFRGFERFCIGRQAEDMPVITNRICGVCPEAHHMAALKALDQIFMVDPPRTAILLRRLLYDAYIYTDHVTHFYALSGPDFIVGPDAPASERNILGVIHKVGKEMGKEVLHARHRNHEIIQIIGGRMVHPAAGVPGGWTTTLSEENRQKILEYSIENLEFVRLSFKVFEKIWMEDAVNNEITTGDGYVHNTYYMGVVDDNLHVDFYEGDIRVVDPNGVPYAKFDSRDLGDHVAERVEPWSYLKFPYLKNVGWNGFTDGVDSGVYVATPQGRLNAADGMATPEAQERFEYFYDLFGDGKNELGRFKPVHHRMATHLARLVEMTQASEQMIELCKDPDITGPDIRAQPQGVNLEGGYGTVEAARGTLTHHYKTDENGILTSVNLIVGTTNNNAAMAMSVKRAAEHYIKKGKVDQGILNRVEMAFRIYDPCLGCATHNMPGKTPLIVTIRTADGAIHDVLRRD